MNLIQINSPMKRRASFDINSTDQLKRIRNEYYQHKPTIFEDLPNELFCEIFDYLDGCEIYETFLYLNFRLTNLVKNSYLPLKIQFSPRSQLTLEEQCRTVVLPNRHRLLAIHLNTQSIIRHFFDYCFIDDSFVRLQSIHLSEITTNKLITILFDLNYLPRLSSLTIQLEEDYYHNLHDVYRLIFRFKTLKYFKLSIADCEESDIYIPNSINERFSPLEYLIMNFPCTIKEMTSLLRHTPSLRRLTCERILESDKMNSNQIEPLKLSQLTHISIDDCDIGLDELEKFIKPIALQLKIFKIKTSYSSAYLDAHRWKQFIGKSMPNLNEFHFDCRINLDFIGEIDTTPNVETIHQFTSKFWTDRRWVFEFISTYEELVYSIRPNRKMWFDQSLTNNQRIQLTIQGYTDETWEPVYIDTMKPCFTAIEFTHLTIDCNGLPIGLLVDIVRLLPNLLSLQLSSWIDLQLQSLSFEDSEMLLLVSITNKISKVKVDKIQTIEQLQLVMDLCPRMQEFHVGYTTDNDLEKIIGCISLNNYTRALYLRHLCLSMNNSKGDIVRTLHDMISFESLFQLESKSFRDYVIQQRDKDVFLHWNLS